VKDVAVKIGVTNYSQMVKELNQMKGKSETVIKRTMSDIRTRVPGWVATEVVKVYNIKKSEITPSKGGSGGKSAGTAQVRGDTIDTAQIVYRGRLLTPVHFGMTPKAPRESYTLKASILKGGKAVIGHKKKLTKKQRQNIGRNFTRQGTRNSPESPYMLQSNGGSGYIPFQRRSQPGKMAYVMRTISMPQMVSSDRTKDNIERAINEGLEKRLAHHMKLLE
jgi:hypothetical protein